VLKVKLKHLNEYAEARRKVAAAYNTAFAEVPQLTAPFRAKNSTHVFHQYTLNTTDINRDELKAYLEAKNIPSMIYYPVPVHMQNGLKSHGFKAGDLLVTEALMKTLISLPIHTEMDDEQLNYIINTVIDFFNKK
jgi:dTDP-4-amino-4,6-dideoxygalactose transaminase